ncbi:unnamed protein product [Clonostachys rosea f. rosea IK726]|uniref:Uncharacterized protein n=1 Tax=Clonostachys rosea f. rosea IK726 TaxID=1349383 RepID=A0ACA9UV54_BIOOC|nr:unnamed protein product [Clonostachys rosea f. rosea IK726]
MKRTNPSRAESEVDLACRDFFRAYPGLRCVIGHQIQEIKTSKSCGCNGIVQSCGRVPEPADFPVTPYWRAFLQKIPV